MRDGLSYEVTKVMGRGWGEMIVWSVVWSTATTTTAAGAVSLLIVIIFSFEVNFSFSSFSLSIYMKCFLIVFFLLQYIYFTISTVSTRMKCI